MNNNNNQQSINYDYQVIQNNNQQSINYNYQVIQNNNQQSIIYDYQVIQNNNKQPSPDSSQSNEVSIHEEENAFVIEDEPVYNSKQTQTESPPEYVDIRLLSNHSSPLFLLLFIILIISTILFLFY